MHYYGEQIIILGLLGALLRPQKFCLSDILECFCANHNCVILIVIFIVCAGRNAFVVVSRNTPKKKKNRMLSIAHKRHLWVRAIFYKPPTSKAHFVLSGLYRNLIFTDIH